MDCIILEIEHRSNKKYRLPHVYLNFT